MLSLHGVLSSIQRLPLCGLPAVPNTVSRVRTTLIQPSNRRNSPSSSVQHQRQPQQQQQQEQLEMAAIVAAPPNMLFRQLFEKESSTYTYLVADLAHPDKPSVLVDPVDRTVERDVLLVKELGLKLQYVVNTHVHADHITGTGLLKKRVPGVKSVISKASGAAADVRVEQWDKVRFGGLYLEVRSTPGHTEGCVTYVTGEGADQVSPRLAFTGDALLIRGCGRTDFQGGDTEMLYNSVHSQIFSLPEDTFVYPAHDYRGQTVSTVGEEKRLNPRLSQDLATFKSIMSNLKLAFPAMIDKAVPANLKCGIQDEVVLESNGSTTA